MRLDYQGPGQRHVGHPVVRRAGWIAFTGSVLGPSLMVLALVLHRVNGRLPTPVIAPRWLGPMIAIGFGIVIASFLLGILARSTRQARAAIAICIITLLALWAIVDGKMV